MPTMPAHSGWSSLIAPLPISVGETGMSSFSASATSSADASLTITPPPATISGRSAPASSSSARSMAATGAAGRVHSSCTSVSASYSMSGPFCTFRGRSISTGPGRPSRAIRNASRNAHGSCAVSFTCTAHLQTGRAISTMSTAWNASRCSTSVFAWPVMQIIGIESASAV